MSEEIPAYWKGDTNAYYANKCARQARAIRDLEARLLASKQADLAARYVRAEAQVARLSDLNARRESAYVKGYQAGYMAALARHELDRP